MGVFDSWAPRDVLVLVIATPLVATFCMIALSGSGVFRRTAVVERFRCCCGRCKP